ncbi:MAG: DUF721 domain-containing protein [Gaiellaceae bacterium MAG52_C11]|nr:DUF721 domain-containing protein [Candidatus Gaiellasilicea maunaloa]
MDRLEGQFRRELRRFGPSDSARGGEMVAIVRAWPAVVGAENARRAWPARLTREGALVVHATDSVWAFQLGMLSASILERLVAELGEEAPAALKFVPGSVPAPAADPGGGSSSSPPQILPEDAEQGAELAASIEDEELRELVARAAAASLARARSDRAF